MSKEAHLSALTPEVVQAFIKANDAIWEHEVVLEMSEQIKEVDLASLEPRS